MKKYLEQLKQKAIEEFEQAVREEIKQEINKIELTLSEEDKKKLEGESVEFGVGYGQTWLLNKINKLLEPGPDRDYEADLIKGR